MPTEVKTKKILIAEDEGSIANALALKLTHSGFEAKIAVNGEEALEFLKKEHFDLLLLDMIMPKVSGFEVLEEISKQNIKIPVLITSNLGQAEDRSFAEKMGVVGYFVKSDIPLYEVIDKVKSFLN